jgi:hypothetical protein
MSVTWPCGSALQLSKVGNRYTPADFSEQLTEVNIKEGGQVEVTGFPTLGWLW